MNIKSAINGLNRRAHSQNFHSKKCLKINALINGGEKLNKIIRSVKILLMNDLPFWSHHLTSFQLFVSLVII